MTIPAVAKIGGAGIVAASVPTTVYFAHDHIFLYQIERDVINGDEKLTVGDPEGETTEANSVAVELKVNNSTKWSCIIKATLKPGRESTVSLDASSDKANLKSYIEKNIPSTASTSDTSVDDSVKQKNKRKLVLGCSGNRISVTDVSIKSRWGIEVEKENGKLMVSLFGTREVATSS